MSTQITPEHKQRIKKALLAFSITAWITGVCLLLLCTRMIFQYGLNAEIPGWAKPIGIVHGWAYALFFLCTLFLGVQARWNITRWITTAAAGVVPFLSFFVEYNRRQEVTEQFQLNRLD